MNARNKKVDTTYLSLDKAEERGFIHRDYIAHCMRWSHVMKRMAEKKQFATARILDVGCGREMPLAKTLYSSRYIVEQYFGVDAGPILQSTLDVFEGGKFPIKVWEHTDICDLTLEDLDDRQVNWATMFEVAEHVEPKHLIAMLEKIQELMTDDGTFLMSTPCWNRTDCAANHVNEMTYESLGALLEDQGFVVENVYGTFASIRDYEHLLKNGNEMITHPEIGIVHPLRYAFNQLRQYYDTNFLSCVFAPLFPAQSRNCLWELRKAGIRAPGVDGIVPTSKEELHRLRKRRNDYKFKPLKDCERPWGSSHLWEEMAG